MYRRTILCTLYGAVDFLNVLKKYITTVLLFKMFIGSNKTVLQNFLRHDTAYALFKLHRVLHYLRHDTAGALKYFTVLSYENKKRSIVLCYQLMTMEAQ
jgi:hypothetical protein